MGEEKVRVSGEISRDAPILPTVNPGSEKPSPAKSGGMHASVYVMSVENIFKAFNKG